MRAIHLLGSMAALVALRAQDDVRALADSSSWIVHEVGDGVELRQRRFASLFGAPQSLSVLVVAKSGRVHFDLVAPGRRTRTSAMAQAGGALAAINGGFFAIETTGLSTGLLRLDGALAVPAKPAQASVGFDARGWPVLATRATADWPETTDALGAGPMLLVDGVVVDHGERQRAIRHPRSAFGLGRDRVLWLAVDGRVPQAAGTTFEETAVVMQALGCTDALNLDGGGSTTLWVVGRGVVNHPCDNRRFDHDGERAVANAILLRAPAVIVVDDEAAELLGEGWRRCAGGEAAHVGGFAATGSVDATAVFRAELPFAGRWRAFGRQPVAAAVPWRCRLPGASVPVVMAPSPGVWWELGECELALPGPAAVEFTSADGGLLVVDAVRWLQVIE